MRFSLLAATGIFVLGHAAKRADWTPNVQNLFDESMKWMDTYYDVDLGYLYDLDRGMALRHNSRTSVWYALGLLARNEGSDASEADRIINNVIGGQFTDPAKQWYGTYQKNPEEPEVDSEHYPAKIYSTWDPNWRGFVATTFVVMLEEYTDRISDETQKTILDSLQHAVIGDTYRVGGVDSDNLYPSYSNPSLMRAFVSGWYGRQADDKNATQAGEDYANEIIELFNKTETLSEFNSATYTGISLMALNLWSQYLPEDSVMSKMGPKMWSRTWEAVEQVWHPGLKNIAGPWDRTYGYDMNRYFSVMAGWIWAYVGKDACGVINQPKIMSHSADFAIAPLLATIAGGGASLLPDDFFQNFGAVDEARTFKTQAYAPPYDNSIRNITTWVSEKIAIGGQSFDQTQVGGATAASSSFTPAVVQWRWNKEIGFLTLHPTEKALQAEVSENKLSLTYPDGDGDSVFTFWVSTFRANPTLRSLKDIPNIGIVVSGNVNKDYRMEFAGANGGELGTANDFEYWSFTFSMPDSFDGAPKLVLDFETPQKEHFKSSLYRKSLEHKKAAMTQIAAIIAQLSTIQFDQIGCPKEDGGMGPIMNVSSTKLRGPFSSTEDFLHSFASTEDRESKKLIGILEQPQGALNKYCQANRHEGYLQSPFCMIHADLDGQNILFTQPSDGSPPQLTRLIDFEYAYAGPLYYLYEYPIFTQDVSWSPEKYCHNAILRPHFVREIWRHLPDARSREIFIACMNDKCYELSRFQACFMQYRGDESDVTLYAECYLSGLGGDASPYDGVINFRPEKYLEDGTVARTEDEP